MNELTLQEVKQHLGVEEFDGDDPYILSLMAASKNVVEGQLGYSFEQYYSSYGEVLPIFLHAQKLVIASMYRDREVTTSLNLRENPFGLSAFLSPYINLFF